MRLIDADAALEIFQKLTELAVGEGAALVKALIFAGLKSRSVTPTVGGWISVKDRLPEVGKVVLAFGTRSATTGMFQGAMTNRPDVWMWKNHTPNRVTHWMPLPEPPEEAAQ